MGKGKKAIEGTEKVTEVITRVLRPRIAKKTYEKENIKQKQTKPKKIQPAFPKKSGLSSKVLTTTEISAYAGVHVYSKKDFQDVCNIGSGGFAKVCQAELKPNNEEVALKYISHAKLKRWKMSVNDIHQEVNIHKQLEHKNISKLLGIFEVNNGSKITALVMEFYDKGDLHDFIFLKKHAFSRTDSRKQRYVQQLVSAADYFQKTVNHIHMDIKPENILISSTDQIKLTDFGCAVKMSSPRQIHKQHNGGTKIYRPPEMLGINQPIAFNSTADVWSIGCVAFQLFSVPMGKHPFYPVYNGAGSLNKSQLEKAVNLMERFREGICENWNFDEMSEDLREFLVYTIGKNISERLLISEIGKLSFAMKRSPFGVVH